MLYTHRVRASIRGPVARGPTAGALPNLLTFAAHTPKPPARRLVASSRMATRKRLEIRANVYFARWTGRCVASIQSLADGALQPLPQTLTFVLRSVDSCRFECVHRSVRAHRITRWICVSPLLSRYFCSCRRTPRARAVPFKVRDQVPTCSLPKSLTSRANVHVGPRCEV